jgi:16S rRNA (cytosine1402-N4)-methyltransferase
MPKQKKSPSVHTPVLLKEVLECLNPQPDESYLDLTAGYGGHAAAINNQTKSPEKAVLVDRDQAAIAALRKAFGSSKARIIHSDYLGASQALKGEDAQFDMILADLGASSLHFDSADRGFAFSNPGPLDMRMDQSQTLTAGIILNTWKEAKIAQVLYEYGQEPKSRAIARRIVASRPLTTTDQLADIVSRQYHGYKRTHPATRTFQALRIAVNDELAQLADSLPLWTALLAPGGRLAVISFHSLEDAIVKKYFAEVAANTYDAELQAITKKPLFAQIDEIDSNPRARSAKLRAVAKIKTKERIHKGNTL